jgi:hypothetical protein
MKQKIGARVGSDTSSARLQILYRLLRRPSAVVPSQANLDPHELTKRGDDVGNASERPSSHPNPATIFLRLCNLSSFPIERINPYKTALWRQVAQTLFILDACKKRLPAP